MVSGGQSAIRTALSGIAVFLALLAAPLPAYAQETTGSIHGQITISGSDDGFIVPVRLYDSTGTLLQEGRNFFTGSYNFRDLTPGTYHVQAGDQWYSGKASFAESDPVLVTPGGSAQGIDFTFDFNDLGWIEGRVYDAETNEPLCITIADQIRPRGDGTYTLGLYPGSWKIDFLDNCEFDYATQWWDGKPDEASADVIEVTGGDVITGIDAAMRPPEDPGGWISGTVIDAETGEKIGGICPIPYHDESGEQVEFAPSTQYGPAPSAQDGTYRIGFLGEGTFRVQFADCQNFVYETRWWREASSFESADPISVSLGEEVSGINMNLELRPGATRPEDDVGSDQAGPPGPVQSAGGTEPEVQSGGELPFTGIGETLGWLAVLATVTLGLGVMLVGWRTRTRNTGD